VSPDESYASAYSHVLSRRAQLPATELRRLLVIEKHDHEAAIIGSREWHATAGRAAAYMVLLSRASRRARTAATGEVLGDRP
jgi:hypothetical protein